MPSWIRLVPRLVRKMPAYFQLERWLGAGANACLMGPVSVLEVGCCWYCRPATLLSIQPMLPNQQYWLIYIAHLMH